ncbi:MAG: hypothetical protein RMJ59_00875 [Candidatus Nitrosocaldus sp.]|nr:hypothetical protein [Candidatus Nitrosocaldus sp.]MCS7141350.1 hypothetical protein [Candidatus Nitrosocaldus sp.]MDW8000315.1 hypothetical protein [Candidatus Nitrosocaldus sp.]MDW8274918.1 hypothetical protein [Candidatus Nitrosocaldus sp.]
MIGGMAVVALVLVAVYAYNSSFHLFASSVAQDDYITADGVLDGACYTFTGEAKKTLIVETNRAMYAGLLIQLEAIEGPDALISIGFEGSSGDVNSFIDKYGITDINIIRGSLDGSHASVQGLIKKSYLEEIFGRLVNTPEVFGDPSKGVEATIVVLESFTSENGTKYFSEYLPINQIPPSKVGEVQEKVRELDYEAHKKAASMPGAIKGCW